MARASDVAGYSIRVASRLSGISADTLRMWERRYGFPKPDRNSSQVRVYSKEDVERLTLVARALKSGYRPGEVIHKAPAELEQMLAAAAPSPPDPSLPGASPVRRVLEALQADDADAVRDHLRQAVATLGPRRFIAEVAGPLLERVGDAWAAQRIEIRHEHLLADSLTTQLRLLLSAYEGRTGEPIMLLTTLPEERHYVGLEMVALYSALLGATPRLLGPDTPLDQIVESTRALSATVVGLSISAAADLAATEAQLTQLLDALPKEVEVWIGGLRARELGMTHSRLRRVVTWPELEREISRLTSA